MIGRVNVAGRGEGPAPGPAYSVEKWCKVVGLTYSDISDITEADMRKLMSKHASVDYFLEWYNADNSMLDDFTQSEIAMKWIGQNDYIADKLLAIEDAESRLRASEYWGYILKDKVPIMTANDAPYGEAFGSEFYEGKNPWNAFSTNTNYWNSKGSFPQQIGYKFVNPICVKKFSYYAKNTYSPTTFVIQASNTGADDDWTDLTPVITTTDISGTYDISNDNYYLFYRMDITAGTSSQILITNLQFYGRSLSVSVPVMTSDTQPYGEVVGDYPSTTSYMAFNKDESTRAELLSSTSSNSFIAYRFHEPIKVKVAYLHESFNNCYATFKYSDDGVNWLDASDRLSIAYRAFANINADSHRYWGVALERVGAVGSMSLFELNFFGVDYSEPSENYRKMTAIIDLANSNPSTCVTYADDAIGMEKGSDEWDRFFGHYPCMLKDGEELGVLRRSDFSKWEFSNQNADITSGANGDVMIAFPRRGLSIKTVDNKVYISMTDNPNDSEFEYNAHTRGTDDLEKFYLGAHKGYVADGKLRSLSGKTITASKTIGEFRTLAQANGDGYEQSGFYQLTFRQAMYALKYPDLASQIVVGMGYVKSSHTSAIATGGSEEYGMDSEVIRATNPTYMTDQDHHVKLFGLEDFWGNVWEFIDGLITDANRNILTANSNFNDNGIGYENNGNGGVSSNIGNYMSKPQGSTKAGFVAKEVSGSESTYFCDTATLYASRVAIFGGTSNNAAAAGVFRLTLYYAASDFDGSVTARLMYLKKGVI